MDLINILERLLRNPYTLFLRLRKLLIWLPDRLYLKLYFRAKMGYEIDFKNPKTFNEKIQWLKLYDRDPDYTKMVDKYGVRKYITKILGEQYLIPLLGVFNSFEDINFNNLPEQFVLKCTHDSGGIYICENKSKLQINSVRKYINKSLRRNYYYKSREWPYKHIKPKIICEQYMAEDSREGINDYKIFCFNGEPKLIQVDFDRFKDHKRNLYDTSWNFIDASIKHPNNPSIQIQKPEKLDDMLLMAKKLSKNIPHVRVDFYYIKGQIYFGELTFHHGSGTEKMEPAKLDRLMGEWLELPSKYIRL